MALINLSAAVKFGCRDKDLTKDSILRNMILEKDGAGDLVAIKRAAISAATSLTNPSNVGKGIYYRKHTTQPVTPPDLGNNEAEDAASPINVFASNVKGQFICGGGDIAYAEDNNSNNWQLGQDLGTNYVTGAAYSYDAGEWVVVTNNGTPYTASDSDLSSWTTRSSFAFAARDVAYCFGATDEFVAVGPSGGIASSSDNGATWTTRTDPDSENRNAVASDQSMFVSVGDNGSIITSSDGITWTSRTSGTAADLHGVAYSHKTGYWVAVGDSSTILYSSNGTSWTAGSGGSGNLVAVFAPEENESQVDMADFVVVGSGIWYSDDNGATFTGATVVGDEYGTLLGSYDVVGNAVVEEENAIASGRVPGTNGLVAHNSSPSTFRAATSVNGRDWFMGDSYKQAYLVGSITGGNADIIIDNGTNSDTYPFDSGTAASQNTTDSQEKVFFDELYITNNAVLAIQHPGSNLNDKGGLAICIGNSIPIYFGMGTLTSDNSYMEYPFPWSGAASEYLVHGVVALDGYLFIMTNEGNIYHSALNNPRSWSALNVINAEFSGDNGVALVKHHNHIVAFGEHSTEFFYNAANATGSVLTRREDIRYQVGCVDGNTIGTSKDVTCFIGKSQNDADFGVYALVNFQLKKISNYYVDNFIRNFPIYNSTDDDYALHGEVLTIQGHLVYVLTAHANGGSRKSIVYDFNTEQWHHWYIQDRSGTSGWGFQGGTHDVMDIVSATSDEQGRTIVMLEDGDTYYIDSEVYQDYSSNPIECVVQTSNIDIPDIPARVRKRWNSLSYVGDEASSSEEITIKYTDDDYQSWSTGRTLDISKEFPILHNFGMARRRAYSITHTANSFFRFKGLDADIKVLRR